MQNEAPKIATDATKLVSLEKLRDEVKRQPLQKRRDNHKHTHTQEADVTGQLRMNCE